MAGSNNSSPANEAVLDDKMFRRWISPIETMLGSQGNVGNLIKANSIPFVPGQLQKSNEEAYKPKVVSIGPRHRGDKDLQYMEYIKWKCMHDLLDKTKNLKEYLRKCGEAILNLDVAVRATYMVIDVDRYELAKIMLLDACFLLRLLTIFILDEKEIDHRTAFKKLQQLLGNGVKVEDVLSDLKLVENQIPLFIIDKLYQIVLLSENNPTSVKQATETLINSCALSLCGCSLGSNNVHKLERAHFLELTHSFLTRKENGDKEENATNPAQEINKEVSVPIDEHRVTSMVIWVGKKDADGNGNQTSKRETKSKLKSCTARLQAAGIKIEAFPLPFNCTSSVEEVVPFGCKFEWRSGVLTIQSLCVNDETKVQWRNFIAWEQIRIGDKQTKKTFSQYALLFQGLVCSEYDVELLKKNKVLKVLDENKWNNEKLKKFIDDIGEGIQVEASADARFSAMINDLNNICYKRNQLNDGAEGNSCTIMTWHHYTIGFTHARETFRYLRETLNHDYTSTPWKTLGVVAGVVLLGLTIAQTVLAAISL